MSEDWGAFPVANKAMVPVGAPSEWDAFPVAPPITANAVARSAATGVPIIGGLLNRMDAATNAALAPVLNPLFDEKNQLKEPTFAGRYAHSLREQNAMDEAFAAEHPVVDTAAQVTGGLASMGGALKAAPTIAPRLFGMTGKTLPSQIMQGGASGAALGAADAATRGTDMKTAAEIGGITGVAGPVVGRAIGKGIQAIRGLKQPAAVPANVADIAGVPVRQSLGQATGDTEAIAREQMALRGADNSQEQAVARDFFNAQKGELGDASRAIAARMSPTGEVLAENPQEAASVLLDSLGQHGQAQATEATQRNQILDRAKTQLSQVLGGGAPANPLDAASVVSTQIGQARALQAQQAQQATERLAGQGETIRRGLAGGMPLASNPMEAANIVSGAIGHASEQAQQATANAYGALRELPGHFHPATFNTMADDIRAGLNRGAEPIRIDPQRTPQAHAALSDLDEMLSDLHQQRDPQTGRILPKPPTTPQVVETARQRLNTFLGDALQAARTSNNWSDVRAMRGVMDAFDEHVAGRLGAGTFIGGDPQGVADAMQTARGLHAQYRRTFTPQGAGDQVGQAVQKIVGRYEGQASPPEEIAGMLYGKGTLPVKVAQRLVGMFGADSPEIGAIKQGLFAHLTETPGLGRLAPEAAANRIDQFLASSTLPQIYLRPQERQALSAYAQSLRGSVAAPAAATDQVARVLPRITGEGGGQPMTAQEVSDTIFGRGMAGDNPTGVKLAEHVRDTHGPQSPAFQAIRQGLFSKLHGADSAETAANVQDFLTGRGRPMAEATFTPQERQVLDLYGKAHAENAARSAAPVTQTDKIMARLTGADGHAPPTTSDVVQYLNTTKGVSRPVQLVQRLKSEFGEGSREFSALKQGQWAYLNENKTGPLDVGSKAVVSKFKDFLDGPGKPLAHAMFTADERDLIRAYGNLMERITPPSGTVNYSNTASVLGKMFRGTMDGLFAAGGVSMAGPVGVAAGLAAHQGQKILQDTVRASKVARSLYGTPQSAAAMDELQKTLARLAAFTTRSTTAVTPPRASNQ